MNGRQVTQNMDCRHVYGAISEGGRCWERTSGYIYIYGCLIELVEDKVLFHLSHCIIQWVCLTVNVLNVTEVGSLLSSMTSAEEREQ